MIPAVKIEKESRCQIINLFDNPKKEKDLTCSEYTSRGVKKASAAESVRSYDDIKMIQDFYLKNNRIRDYMMFTVGVCTGFRISDLLRIKIGDVINADGTFREYIYIREKKTGKLSTNADDKCLITEAMRIAISKYLKTLKKYNLDDYLVYSKSPENNHKLSEVSGWRILNSAQTALDLPFHLSSHSMRKSFANIAACIGGETNINMSKLLSIQHMLKHSDYKTTMRYLRLTSVFTEEARKNVSDFVLGKTDKNVLSDALLERKSSENEKLDAIMQALEKIIELTDE